MELENTIKSNLHRALDILNDDSRPNEAIPVDFAHYKEYLELLYENLNLVLTGAPGTGKTYMAKNLAALLIGNCSWDDLDDEQKTHAEFVQFHPSFDYTDFIEGLRPNKSGNFIRTNGVFKDFCNLAYRHNCRTEEEALAAFKADIVEKGILPIPYVDSKGVFFVSVADKGRLSITLSKEDGHPQSATDETVINAIKTGKKENKLTYAHCIGCYIKKYYLGQNYVFIIDEINRGEISKIFGELFYSIEPDYRGEKTRVRTQYNNMVEDDDVFRNGFFVPENVYIIGTMNDIDRGVEAMDFAIRRRFAWREVTAKESADNMGLSDLAKKKMTALNEALKSKGLNQAYYIGGAYFRKLKGTDFDSLWKYHLKGIVSEYFRGEPEADKKVEEVGEAYTAATIEVSAEQPTLNPSTEQQSE